MSKEQYQQKWYIFIQLHGNLYSHQSLGIDESGKLHHRYHSYKKSCAKVKWMLTQHFFCPLVVVRLKKNLKHKNTIVSTLMWNLHHSLGNYMVLVMKDAKLSYPEALAQVSLHSPHTCSRSPFPGPCGVLSLFTSSPLAFFRLLMAVACMISLMMFRLCGRQEVRAGGLGCGWIICLQVVHLHTATLLWG